MKLLLGFFAALLLQLLASCNRPSNYPIKKAKLGDITILSASMEGKEPVYYAGSDSIYHYFYQQITPDITLYLRTSRTAVKIAKEFVVNSTENPRILSEEEIQKDKKP